MKQVLIYLGLFLLVIFAVEHTDSFNVLLSGAINLFGMLVIGIVNVLLFTVTSLMQLAS